PALIAFDASASSDSDGSIASYNWNFGDGTSSTAVAPSHSYSAAGDYTVTLTVTDNEGASSPLVSTTLSIISDSTHTPIAIQSSITDVQPMTGIVLWENSWNSHAIKAPGNIQLEYAYMPYDAVVTGENSYDWSSLDALLDRIAGRQHQAVIRFYYSYPGQQTTVPAYIKALPNYVETLGTSEGQATWFPDWSQQALQTFNTNFYTALAARYDDDPRLAFLQIGFGLWAEYHIYDGPNTLGQQFPSKNYQHIFLKHLSTIFNQLHWSVSIDAASSYYSPFSADQDLLDLPFGTFDDSFMHAGHDDYNAQSWQFFDYQQRYAASPHGGELSYYTGFDQRNALNVAGIHGRTYEALSAQYHISYMIGNDQPSYQSVARIKQAGMSNGYRFRVTRFDANDSESIVTVSNTGIAPIYYPAYVTVDGTRATQSLKGLLPGEERTYRVAAGGHAPSLTIESDRLVAGQRIQFEADLN
ncbi:MAG: PKD domain-containing protein, partial [Cellvibrionaceae bacterium]|nr:PKD domain-containing protein [Cellvibrionaceae bacterium]